MTEGLKGGKSIKPLRTAESTNTYFLGFFFPPEIGRDHYHHSCHLLGTPCVQNCSTKHFLLPSTKEIRHLILSFHGLALIGKDIVGKP